MRVNFDVNDLFSKMSEDTDLQKLFSTYGITFDFIYQEEVVKRIQSIYNKNFDLYDYLNGGSIPKLIKMLFTKDTKDIYDFIGISDGSFKITLSFNDTEEVYEEGFVNLNFYDLCSIKHTGIAEGTSTLTTIVDSTYNFLTINKDEYFVRFTSNNQNKNLLSRITKLTKDTIYIEDTALEPTINNGYELVKMPTIYSIVKYLNDSIESQSQISLIKDNVYFQYEPSTNRLSLNMDEIKNELRKITLTISDLYQTGSISYPVGFNKYGTAYSSNYNVISFFLNENPSGFVSEPLPWESTFVNYWNAKDNVPDITDVDLMDENFYYKVNEGGNTLVNGEDNWNGNDKVYYINEEWIKNPETHAYTNYELLLYCFNLDDIYNNTKAKNEICYKLLYDFRYTGANWFFLKNQKSFFSEFDYNTIKTTNQLRVFINSLMTEFDRISSKIEDIKDVKNVDLTEEEYLDYIAYELGYTREEFNLNNISFRELIKNILNIYKFKGTNFGLETFFKFLGFKATVTEFWFDRREILNSLANIYTKESSPYTFKHYLVTNPPHYTSNKYKGAVTYDGLSCDIDFDVIQKYEFQETKDLLAFDRIVNDTNINFVLRNLGLGAVAPILDGSWSLNVEVAEESGPKFPYYYGETLSPTDYANMDGLDGDKYHENDFSLFYNEYYSDLQQLYLDGKYYFIKDKSDVPDYVEVDEEYKYFKTNYVTVSLDPFKENLTSNDAKIIDKYLRYLFPSYVIFEPIIRIPEEEPDSMAESDDSHLTDRDGESDSESYFVQTESAPMCMLNYRASNTYLNEVSSNTTEGFDKFDGVGFDNKGYTSIYGYLEGNLYCNGYKRTKYDLCTVQKRRYEVVSSEDLLSSATIGFGGIGFFNIGII